MKRAILTKLAAIFYLLGSLCFFLSTTLPGNE
jgi:hypothetical protein